MPVGLLALIIPTSVDTPVGVKKAPTKETELALLVEGSDMVTRAAQPAAACRSGRLCDGDCLSGVAFSRTSRQPAMQVCRAGASDPRRWLSPDSRELAPSARGISSNAQHYPPASG